MTGGPNVLWITTDHHRTDALGCYGSDWAHSPNIDALAGRGVVFSQCTCPSPQCTPSRNSVWSGRRPCDMGPFAYGKADRPADLVPLIRPFREAGYTIAHFGKFDDPSLAGEFDISDIGEEGGYGDPFCSGVKDESLLRLPGTGLVYGGRNPKPYEETVCATMARRAERFLENEAANGPFVLRVSINVPHSPVIPLPEYYGTTDRKKIDLSIPSQEELATKPLRESRRIRRFYVFDQFTPEELLYIRGCFYDLCAELDAAIGRILKSLEDNGYGDDTIVVLHPDHGTTLGEHGVGTIRTFYDPVVQVPFVWSWPGGLPQAKVVGDPVEMFALIPSLLDLAGLDVPAQIDDDARSVVPLMRGRHGDVHRPTFSEFDTSLSPIGGSDWIPEEACWYPEHDRRIMVRCDGWKLECNYGPSEYGEDGALYNLRDDPDELVNLFGDSQYRPKVQELQGIVREKFNV